MEAPAARNPGGQFSALGTRDRALVIVAGGDHAAFLERPRPYFLDVLDAFLTGGARR